MIGRKHGKRKPKPTNSSLSSCSEPPMMARIPLAAVAPRSQEPKNRWWNSLLLSLGWVESWKQAASTGFKPCLLRASKRCGSRPRASAPSGPATMRRPVVLGCLPWTGPARECALALFDALHSTLRLTCILDCFAGAAVPRRLPMCRGRSHRMRFRRFAEPFLPGGL